MDDDMAVAQHDYEKSMEEQRQQYELWEGQSMMA